MYTSTRKFATVATAIALAVGATFTLGGCFGNPIEGLAQGGANEIINNGPGEGVELSGQSIPKNFPTQVPLIEGEVASGGALTSEGETMWTVQILANDPNVSEKIQQQMASAGFEGSFSAVGDDAIGGFEGNEYETLVTVTERDGQISVSYIVSPAEDD